MARFFWTQKQDFGPVARAIHRMTYDSTRQRVVLFGGRLSTAEMVNDTWEWDGEYWTLVHTLGPAPRGAHALAFDSARSRTVCFGGLSKLEDPASAFGDTWEWDGTDWTQIADTGPVARSFHVMAYDSDRGRVILFGGQAGDGFLNDTWEWDGIRWTQLAETGPSARDACGSAYDTSRKRIVIFGGEILLDGGQIANVGETWEFGEAVWTKVATAGPGPIVGPLMVYTGSDTLLYNPTDGTTWTWNGAHWTERQRFGPGSRSGAAAAYDSRRERVVLFGGGLLQDTWELSEIA